MSLKMFWWKRTHGKPNFGDELGPLIVEHLSGHRVTWAHLRTADLSAIGADIIHARINFDSTALGKTSHLDFLTFAESIRHLEGGVFLNIGSAVTGPEVYRKELSMVLNIDHPKEGGLIVK